MSVVGWLFLVPRSLEMKIEKVRAKSWVKCACCGEQIRTAETFLQVVNNDGKPVKGERYCELCEDVAYENNPELYDGADDSESDGEEHLRRMEDYASYLYNGNPQDYWSDRDAGYAH